MVRWIYTVLVLTSCAEEKKKDLFEIFVLQIPTRGTSVKNNTSTFLSNINLTMTKSYPEYLSEIKLWEFILYTTVILIQFSTSGATSKKNQSCDIYFSKYKIDQGRVSFGDLSAMHSWEVSLNWVVIQFSTRDATDAKNLLKVFWKLYIWPWQKLIMKFWAKFLCLMYLALFLTS